MKIKTNNINRVIDYLRQYDISYDIDNRPSGFYISYEALMGDVLNMINYINRMDDVKISLKINRLKIIFLED